MEKIINNDSNPIAKYIVKEAELVKSTPSIDGREWEEIVETAAKNYEAYKEEGHIINLKLGHEPYFGESEKDRLGWLENIQLRDQAIIGDWYFLEESTKEKFKNGIWNGRSIEFDYWEKVRDVEVFDTETGKKTTRAEPYGWVIHGMAVCSSSNPAFPNLKPFNKDFKFEELNLKNNNKLLLVASAQGSYFGTLYQEIKDKEVENLMTEKEKENLEKLQDENKTLNVSLKELTTERDGLKQSNELLSTDNKKLKELSKTPDEKDSEIKELKNNVNVLKSQKETFEDLANNATTKLAEMEVVEAGRLIDDALTSFRIFANEKEAYEKTYGEVYKGEKHEMFKLFLESLPVKKHLAELATEMSSNESELKFIPKDELQALKEMGYNDKEIQEANELRKLEVV